MSLMVRPSRNNPVLVNFEAKEKNYRGNRFLCPSDGCARDHKFFLCAYPFAKSLRALSEGLEYRPVSFFVTAMRMFMLVQFGWCNKFRFLFCEIPCKLGANALV